jgi:hypothetical protein
VGLTTPPRKKQIVTRSEKSAAGWTYLRRSKKWGRMEEAFEEGQGPHRAVEPVMMIIYIRVVGIQPKFTHECYHSGKMIQTSSLFLTTGLIFYTIAYLCK